MMLLLPRTVSRPLRRLPGTPHQPARGLAITGAPPVEQPDTDADDAATLGWRKENRVIKAWRVESAEALKDKTGEGAVPPALVGLPCVAVMGRTNCGKSSLLNALFGKGHKQRARASSVAGRTDAVEVFAINSSFALADFPGHSGFDDETVPRDGFSFAKSWRGTWGPLAHGFLKRFAPTVLRSQGDKGGKGLDWGAAARDAAVSSSSSSTSTSTSTSTSSSTSSSSSSSSSSGLVAGAAAEAPSAFGLHGVLFLCDVRWKCSDEDRRLLASLAKLQLPTLVVFTKDDRVAADLARNSKGHARRRASADPRDVEAASADVHYARARLVATRRQELGWEGPHVHFTSGDAGALVEKRSAEEDGGAAGAAGRDGPGLLSPRRCRNQLRRFVASLCEAKSPAARHALLAAAIPKAREGAAVGSKSDGEGVSDGQGLAPGDMGDDAGYDEEAPAVKRAKAQAKAAAAKVPRGSARGHAGAYGALVSEVKRPRVTARIILSK